jgi:hypothetical protein
MLIHKKYAFICTIKPCPAYFLVARKKCAFALKSGA